jgi:sterol desaturase/sphingolipid hydroxylase (fatty acid hydroxylase superfamily)
LVLAAERARPWRREQPLLRPLLLQDVLWFAFNGYLLGMLLAPYFSWAGAWINQGYAALAGATPDTVRFLSGHSLWVQVPVLLVFADFFEWLVHNLLHRVGPLWRLHRVHHSIHFMDWIGNFRFHWLEVVIYQTVKHLPLALLGADGRAVLIVAVAATLIGHINHANLDISWGPLRYLLNSPRMHIWHHEARLRGRAGVNFGIVLSLWDWLFRTAYMPRSEVPERIGFEGDDRFPTSMWWRFVLPFLDRK